MLHGGEAFCIRKLLDSFTSTGKDAFEVTASLRIPKFAADGMYTMQLGFFGATANRAAAGPFNMSFSKSTFASSKGGSTFDPRRKVDLLC